MTVNQSILINAPLQHVWEVLITPKYIRQWDDLPEDWGDMLLGPGSVIEWTGHVRLTVDVFEPAKELRLSAWFPKVDLDPQEYDVSYHYFLSRDNEQTRLNIRIGDFGPLPDPQKYYDASVEFAENSGQKIKELSEAFAL